MKKNYIFVGFIAIISVVLFFVFFGINNSKAQSTTILDGSLIRTKGTADVYIVKLVGNKKFKRLILNPSVFNSYGHLKWSNILDIEKTVLDSFITSDLVRATVAGDPKVFKLYPSGDIGEKRWITTAEIFNSLGYDWDSIFTINEKDRDSYTEGGNESGKGNSGGLPPQEAVSACVGKSVGATCEFNDKGVSAQGLCDNKPGVIACAPIKSTGNNFNTNNKTSTILSAAANSCINNTKDGSACKDCCDCLSGADGNTRTSCRDTCATHDFTKNYSFTTFTIPSTLGANGNYSQCVAKTTSEECKSCCEGSMGLQCGDYQYCRTACNNKFGITTPSTNNQQNNNPQTQNPNTTNNNYSLEQAISDNAQLSTIAFSGLAFITGSAGADTFFPPGKVADFSGFQYMRDVDIAGYGHNTTFLSRVANNVLYILNDTQKAKLIALAEEQAPIYTNFSYNRFPIMNAFRRNLEGDIPSNSTGLSTSVVSAYTSNLYKLDADLSYNRALVVGEIINSFTDDQKVYLAKMEFDDYSSWPDISEDADLKKSMTNTEFVAVMTYASELFSWYKGNITADVYFCPERHGTYFGGFFMKDYPAMNDPDYFISTAITGDSGQGFLDALNTTQKALITGIISEQKAALTEIVQIRTTVSTELRKAMVGGTPDKELVYSLIERYGELDGQISALYALRYSQVKATLTDAQMATLVKLRNLTIVPTGAYIFSTPTAMPTIPNTDFMFGIGTMSENSGQTIAPIGFGNASN